MNLLLGNKAEYVTSGWAKGLEIWDKVVDYAKDKSQMPPPVVSQFRTAGPWVLGIGSLLMLIIVYHFVSVTNGLGWCFGFYQTFFLLAKRQAGCLAYEKESRYEEQWISYWICYGLIMWLEHILELIPFYTLFKFTALCWLALPCFDGAHFCYRYFLVPYLKMYAPPEPKSDKALISLSNEDVPPSLTRRVTKATN